MENRATQPAHHYLSRKHGVPRPRVTVIMSVYNGEKYIGEAVESILNQTYKDFELLIINDGSTDSSKDIIYLYDDKRIRLINNKRNIGLTRSLNKGIRLSQSEYVARMDADDVSLPTRLEKQVKFMDANDDIALCGTWFQSIGNNSDVVWKVPEHDEEIRCLMLFHNPIFHPTVILRRAVLEQFSLSYNPKYRYSQDYDLWVRMLAHSKASNLQEVLLLHRFHAQKIGATNSTAQEKVSNEVRLNLIRNLGIEPNYKDLHIHRAVTHADYETDPEFLYKVDDWFLKLYKANQVKELYAKSTFNRLLFMKWKLIFSFIFYKKYIPVSIIFTLNFLSFTSKSAMLMKYFTLTIRKMLRSAI